MDVINVVDIARRTLLDPSLGPQSKLDEAVGYDSLTHLQFVLELERRSGQKIRGDIAETATLEEVSRLMSAQA